MNREAAAYWVPRFREGMTVEDAAPSRNVGSYNDSGAVAASSHALVASSRCGRTSWRTRAWYALSQLSSSALSM